MRNYSLIALVLVFGLMLTVNVGCMKCGESLTEKLAEKAMEAAVEKGSGGKADIDIGGNVDISSLPGYLRYPGAKAIGRFSMSGEDGKGTVWSLETGDARQKVVDWYKKGLEGKGWKQGMTMDTGEGLMAMYSSPDEKEMATVIASTEDGKTVIALTHASK